MKLVVAELEVLGGQRDVRPGLGALRVVQDEMIGRHRAIENALEIGARDPELQATAHRVQRDRRREEGHGDRSRAGMPATRVPSSTQRRRRDCDRGSDPDEVHQPEREQGHRRPQRFVVDRAREVAAERIVGEHRWIAVQAQEGPEQRHDRDGEGERPAPARPRNGQRREDAGGRRVCDGRQRQQREEAEPGGEAAVADAQRIGDRDQERQRQHCRGGAPGDPAKARQGGAVGGPAPDGHQTVPHVDRGQGGGEPQREAEVVSEHVEERDELQRNRQNREQDRPDERAKAKARSQFVDGSTGGS